MSKNKIKKKIKFWKNIDKHDVCKEFAKKHTKRLERAYNRHRLRNNQKKRYR